MASSSAAPLVASATPTYDTRDRLTVEDTVNYGWDQNGNLISKSGTDGASYEWDFDNRLKRVTLANGMTVEHVYDVDGTRVKTVTTPPGGPAETVEYLVDTSGGLSQVVLEGSSTSSMSAYYVRGDGLISIIRPAAGGPSEIKHYHADGLGSIRALTDSAGVVTDTWQFEAFGEVVAHVGSDPNAYLFAGEMLDSNVGWSYNRARWMDPRVGRFGSMDPLAAVAFERPVSLHRYLYASSNPICRIDPSGLADFSIGGLQVTLSVQGNVRLTSGRKPASTG
jgi:RHS repeat-associated protein